MTPFRLGRALTAPWASQRVEPLADCHRGFQAVFDPTMTSKAFSHHVATARFATCMGTMASRLLGAMPLTVLGCAQGRAWAELRHIVMQEGSALALHDAWRAVWPGRCKVVKPAAVERHTTLAWLCDAPTTVVLTPDTARAPPGFPEPAALRDSVRWAERGARDWPSRGRVPAAGGFVLIRATAGMHPQVVEAGREDGTRRRSRRNQPRTVSQTTRPKRQRVERVVAWQREAHPRRRRLLLSGNRQTKACCSLLPNLPATRSRLAMISRADQWRWHVAFLLKEWQSSAHLHAFDTAKAAIVEGRMWTASAAAALTRFLASMTPLLAAVPMATRTVAMGAGHVFGDLVQALQSGDVPGLYAALEAAVTYRACHAQRAHPKRDRHRGRLQLGLEPLFGSDDVIEFAEAA
jgi:hypothetical protein